jgi:protein gp37
MAQNSKIEWTEATWNPIVGCSIVSPGCTNCYAMKMAGRTEAMGISRYDGTTKQVNGNTVWTGKLARAPEATLLAPLKRKKPTTYFVNSMGDLFHEDCPDEWIDQVFAVMALTPQHTYQVLTKRAARMREYLGCAHQRVADRAMEDAPVGLDIRKSGLTFAPKSTPAVYFEHWPLPNVWLGVSTERQKEANERIPHLLQTPAAIRFISAEPLLGAIDLMEIEIGGDLSWNALGGRGRKGGLDWVIVGGESGPDARPMHPDWARWLRDQCAGAGVPFFFKQWGEHAPSRTSAPPTESDVNRLGDHPVRVGKKAAGRILDGTLHDGMPRTAPAV